jgi:hypothetical protein
MQGSVLEQQQRAALESTHLLHQAVKDVALQLEQQGRALGAMQGQLARLEGGGGGEVAHAVHAPFVEAPSGSAACLGGGEEEEEGEEGEEGEEDAGLSSERSERWTITLSSASLLFQELAQLCLPASGRRARRLMCLTTLEKQDAHRALLVFDSMCALASEQDLLAVREAAPREGRCFLPDAARSALASAAGRLEVLLLARLRFEEAAAGLQEQKGKKFARASAIERRCVKLSQGSSGAGSALMKSLPAPGFWASPQLLAAREVLDEGAWGEGRGVPALDPSEHVSQAGRQAGRERGEAGRESGSEDVGGRPSRGVSSGGRGKRCRRGAGEAEEPFSQVAQAACRDAVRAVRMRKGQVAEAAAAAAAALGGCEGALRLAELHCLARE